MVIRFEYRCNPIAFGFMLTWLYTQKNYAHNYANFITGKQVVNNYHRYARLRTGKEVKVSFHFDLQYQEGVVMPGLVCKF